MITLDFLSNRPSLQDRNMPDKAKTKKKQKILNNIIPEYMASKGYKLQPSNSIRRRRRFWFSKLCKPFLRNKISHDRLNLLPYLVLKKTITNNTKF